MSKFDLQADRLLSPNHDDVAKVVTSTTSKWVEQRVKAIEGSSVHSHVYLDEHQRSTFKSETGLDVLLCEKARIFEHPIQRLLSIRSYEILMELVQSYSSVKEVGANLASAIFGPNQNCAYLKSLKKWHNKGLPSHFAQKLDNADDDARFERDLYKLQSSSDPRAIAIVTNNSNIGYLDNSTLCTKGAEYCIHQADCVIFHQSIYDIKPSTFNMIMENSKAHIAFYTIHAPYEVVYQMDSVFPNLSYDVERHTEGLLFQEQKISFYVDSTGSKAYTHNEQNWHFWATTQTWASETSYYRAEVVASVGHTKIIKVNRVLNRPAESRMKYRMPPFMKDMVLVPNVVALVNDGQAPYRPDFSAGNLKNKSKYWFVMPASKANDFLSAVHRQKTDTSNETTMQTLITQIKASNASLFVGNNQIRTRDPNIDNFSIDIAISIFVIAVAQRTKSSKIIGHELTLLKNEFKHWAWVASLLEKWENFWFQKHWTKEHLLAALQVYEFEDLTFVAKPPKKVSRPIEQLGRPPIYLSSMTGSTSVWKAHGMHNPSKKNASSFVYFLHNVKLNHQSSTKPVVIYAGCAPGHSMSIIAPSFLEDFTIIHLDPKDCQMPNHINSLLRLSGCDHITDYCMTCIKRLKADYFYSDISTGGDPLDEYRLQYGFTQFFKLSCIKLRALSHVSKDHVFRINGDFYRQAYAKVGSQEIRVLVDPTKPCLRLTAGEIEGRMNYFTYHFRNAARDEETFRILMKDAIVKTTEIKPAKLKDLSLADFTVFDLDISEIEAKEYARSLTDQLAEIDLDFKRTSIDEMAHKNLSSAKRAIINFAAQCESGSVQINWHNGVPGEGKSWDIKKSYQKDEIVIAPSNNLMKTYLDDKNKKIICLTYEVAFKNPDPSCPKIYVDEATKLPKAWFLCLRAAYPNAKIFAYGDVLQVGFRNRSKRSVTIVDWPTDYNCTVSRRLPLDCMARRSNFGYPNGTTTTSEELGETDFRCVPDVFAHAKSMNVGESVHIMCLYQEDKKELSETFPNNKITTCDEGQGVSVDEILFIIPLR